MPPGRKPIETASSYVRHGDVVAFGVDRLEVDDDNTRHRHNLKWWLEHGDTRSVWRWTCTCGTRSDWCTIAPGDHATWRPHVTLFHLWLRHLRTEHLDYEL